MSFSFRTYIYFYALQSTVFPAILQYTQILFKQMYRIQVNIQCL